MAMLEIQVEGIATDTLSVRRFCIEERLDELFCISLDVMSADEHLDPEGFLYQPATFFMHAGYGHEEGEGERIFTGLCRHWEQLQAEETGLSAYRLSLLPFAWLMGERVNHRIFQHQSLPAIAEAMLVEHGIDYELRLDLKAYPLLEYRTQYGESDLHFLRRMLEEAGIASTFRFREGLGSVLVLSDSLSGNPMDAVRSVAFEAEPNQASKRAFVSDLQQWRKAHGGEIHLRDFDFLNPQFLNAAKARSVGESQKTLEKRLEQYRFTPGTFRIEGQHKDKLTSSFAVADRQGAARHDSRHGHKIAEQLARARALDAQGISYRSNIFSLSPGTVFSIAGHPNPALDVNTKWLVTKLIVEGEVNKEWSARGEAVPASIEYVPMRKTPKPSAHSYQSAMVVGPRDKEIHGDEFGRIKVRFVWDRESEGDEQSSCWIRVSSPAAGAGYGFVDLPRVGEEVLVAFVGGDPDQPLVVGRMYNLLSPPPYPLPEHQTKTVLRSRSTPASDGFSEISFENKAGHERFFQRAERDREVLVGHDDKLMVGGDREISVRGNIEHVLEGTEHRFVGGAMHLSVAGERREHIGGDESLVVDGHLYEAARGVVGVLGAGGVHIKSGKEVVIEGVDITLKTGGGFIRLTEGGITIVGTLVLINSGGGPGDGAGIAPKAPELPYVEGCLCNTPVYANFVTGWRPELIGMGPTVYANLPPPKVMVERQTMCQAICECKAEQDALGPGVGHEEVDVPMPCGTKKRKKYQVCVDRKLRMLDAAMGGMSRIKVQVPYDMSKSPPEPIMSKHDPSRPTTGLPKGCKAPDAVAVIDPKKPPTRDNLEWVWEVKFPPDRFHPGQHDAYTKIAPLLRFEVFTPEKCGCPEGRLYPIPLLSPQQAQDAAKAMAMIALLILLLGDDLIGLEGDDVLIPDVIRRILELMRAAAKAPPPPVP